MVKIALQIQASLENVELLKTSHPNHAFHLKLKCMNCGEVSDKWHDITESEKFPTKHTKTETNYLAKCKLCSRENSMDILEGTNVAYKSDDLGKFKTIVVFDCRGIEPVDFSPREGWIVKVEESSTVFENVDLSEKVWTDYDEKIGQPIVVDDFESQFVKVK